MREIVLDTETTGLDPLPGYRVVEIGCVELINGIPTGQTFHRYLNPERSMPPEALAVHGLDDQFLKDKDFFAEVVDDLIAFPRRRASGHPQCRFRHRLPQRRARAHRAAADRPRARWSIRCSIARRKHPGASNRLDDLCARYAIDSSRRTKHGALLDAELLAEVYVELIGARQATLILSQAVLPGRGLGEPIIVRAAARAASSRVTGRGARGAPALHRHSRRQGDLAAITSGWGG